MQKEIKELEKKRNNLRFNLFEEQDKIDDNKEIREAFSKFNNCSAVDPAETDIVEWLERMVAE